MFIRSTVKEQCHSIWSGKKTGDWWACGDFHALNSVTIPGRYPLPHIHDCVSSLYGMKSVSTIGIVRSRHPLPVAKVDIPKKAITTPLGMFEFIRMLFGLGSVSQTIQRFIACIFYVPDNLVPSMKEGEHMQRLARIFGD